jgi:hypothetical protein
MFNSFNFELLGKVRIIRQVTYSNSNATSFIADMAYIYTRDTESRLRNEQIEALTRIEKSIQKIEDKVSALDEKVTTDTKVLDSSFGQVKIVGVGLIIFLIATQPELRSFLSSLVSVLKII